MQDSFGSFRVSIKQDFIMQKAPQYLIFYSYNHGAHLNMIAHSFDEVKDSLDTECQSISDNYENWEYADLLKEITIDEETLQKDGDEFYFEFPNTTWVTITKIGTKNKLDHNPLQVTVDLTVFDIARLGKDPLYDLIEEKICTTHNVDIDLLILELLPISNIGEMVTYQCIPTKYKKRGDAC
ncbi:MAG: hypothetical protein COB67_02355 [SAR324 cluster bacterium]|uniref:Uncharacterized protein n=1 Tax=SAR324 cluster bacterium TaxID=2024889 RepID=A0A2A4TAZ0_9DELT|nr:MAG: hypothetical protein COB67_02355 [SAR324 cluster bacterium]